MSKLFEGLERIEEARERIKGLSFMSGLFLGKPDFSVMLPAEENLTEKKAGQAFYQQVETFLKAHVDADEIERSGEIPEQVLKGLFKLGAFGMKIPKEYGGLGFSHKNYGRVLTLIASWSNILSLTVAVPQSIGIAMPILLYGNEQQKQKYLPLVARKEISAFALTEPETGSDAANVQTMAVLDEQGEHFIVNGEKLWCTNGPIARYITLIARVPACKTCKISDVGKKRWRAALNGERAEDNVHTAFILDMQTAGVEVRQQCRFEGCHGIANAHMTFTDVLIPKEDVVGGIGYGLKIALSILNIGRAVSVPAICLGMAKQAWQPSIDRANTRITFKQPLSTRQTQCVRIGNMATDLFAMEALCELVWHMADQKNYDVRIEAAVTKMFCSEKTIQFLNDAQVIFGGMGYETADSKRFRGQPAFGLEQLVRDATMYRIGEGATDVLRPFVAREGLNSHLERIKETIDSGIKLGGIFILIKFYVPWYLSLWKMTDIPHTSEFSHPQVHHKLSYVEKNSRILARTIFYAMLKSREAMRDDQGRQNRIECISEELFTIVSTALYAQRLDHAFAWELADEYFRTAKVRIKWLLKEMLSNDDEQRANIGRQALKGEYAPLNRGIIQRALKDYLPKVHKDL